QRRGSSGAGWRSGGGAGFGSDTDGRVWGGRQRVVESAIRAGKATPPPTSGAEKLGLRVGDDVRHGKWGEGVIILLEGAGDKAEAVVRFRGEGEKRLLLSWAPLEKVAP
ncbi:MAG: ATP-dependent DNA helicase PcrA, partial [Acidimicrobiia bacterium]